MYQVTQTTQDRSNFTLDRSAYLVTVHILNGADGKLESGLSVEKRAGDGQTEPGAKAESILFANRYSRSSGAVVILEVVPHPEVDLRHQEVQVRRVRRRQRRASRRRLFRVFCFQSRKQFFLSRLLCRRREISPMNGSGHCLQELPEWLERDL